MNESFKIYIDSISNHNFFCMSIYNLTSFIIWKDSFKTSCAISIIFYSSTSRINPIDTIVTAFSASMCYTFIGFAYCAFFTSLLITTFSASMCYTFIGFASCTCFTIRFITSVSSSMSFTFIGFAYCAFFTIGFITSISASMFFTFIRFAFCA